MQAQSRVRAVAAASGDAAELLDQKPVPAIESDPSIDRDPRALPDPTEVS
jgi:hypothetical protein